MDSSNWGGWVGPLGKCGLTWYPKIFWSFWIVGPWYQHSTLRETLTNTHSVISDKHPVFQFFQEKNSGKWFKTKFCVCFLTDAFKFPSLSYNVIFPVLLYLAHSHHIMIRNIIVFTLIIFMVYFYPSKPSGSLTNNLKEGILQKYRENKKFKNLKTADSVLLSLCKMQNSSHLPSPSWAILGILSDNMSEPCRHFFFASFWRSMIYTYNSFNLQEMARQNVSERA